MATGGVSQEDSLLGLGSEESYDLECEPCCLDGKSAEAFGMCTTCQDYLCQPCFNGHKLPIPMRGHKLVSSIKQKGNKADGKSSGIVSRPLEKLSHVKDKNVRTKRNEKTCRISGIALLPDQKLAIADNNNHSIRTVDVQTGQVTSQMSLSSSPWDIALIKSPQVAVTLPYEHKIAFVNLRDTPNGDRYLKVNGKCEGVDYREGKLAVAYNNGDKVEVLNIQGTILHSFNTRNESKGFMLTILKSFMPTPSYIAISQDNQSVYISADDTNSLECYSLKGNLLSTYKDDQLHYPMKVITDNSGNVYVCDYRSDTVHQLSSDLRKIQILLNKDDGLDSPYSICYNEHKGEFYVGSSNNDKVKVYKAVNK